MKIPQCNPVASYLSNKEGIDRAISGVFKKGVFILGEEVTGFETEFSNYIGTKYAVGVGSGTEALHIALRACGIGHGDQVITVSHTAVATVAAIELCGAVPVLVDIRPDNYTIDIDQLTKAITNKTKAIMPVHLYGLPADIEEIVSIANRFGLNVIEDCAQAHGAMYKNILVGAWGHIGAFSFYPTKNLGAFGDAGAIVTNDEKIAQKCRSLREYGWRERYISSEKGWNTRLDELQAAILRVKLQALDRANNRRREIANKYSETLRNSGITIPVENRDKYHVYHQYVIRHTKRDSLRRHLLNKDIGTLIHYPVPIHLQPAYVGKINCPFPLTVTEAVKNEILSLPIFPDLTFAQVDYIVSAILEFKE
jgi:dTDP-4-amino-4,6-dideoxygalactose transaminase